MSEEIWNAKLNGINRLFNRCEARETYDVRVSTFSESFRRLISAIPDKSDHMPLASHVRKTVTACLFSEYGKGDRYDKSFLRMPNKIIWCLAM